MANKERAIEELKQIIEELEMTDLADPKFCDMVNDIEYCCQDLKTTTMVQRTRLEDITLCWVTARWQKRMQFCTSFPMKMLIHISFADAKSLAASR